MVEFAFVLLPLLLLTVGTVIYGLVFVSQQAFAFAAQRGADAIVQVDPESVSNLSAYCASGETLARGRVQDLLPLVSLFNGASIDAVDDAAGGQQGCTVTVTKAFPLQIPLLPLPTTLHGEGFVPVSDLSV